MAVAKQPGDVEEWPEKRIQANLEERQRAESAVTPVGIRADGGEDNVHASRVAEQMAMADGEGEDLPALHIGDHVTDRDDEDGAPMVVVGQDTLQADAYELGDGGPTVAEVNPVYPETDDVVEIVFPNRTDMDIDKKRYAYPRTRLELVMPIHDLDGDEEVSK